MHPARSTKRAEVFGEDMKKAQIIRYCISVVLTAAIFWREGWLMGTFSLLMLSGFELFAWRIAQLQRQMDLTLDLFTKNDKLVEDYTEQVDKLVGINKSLGDQIEARYINEQIITLALDEIDKDWRTKGLAKYQLQMGKEIEY